MAWLRTGTISVTNGSTTVVGSGTSWISAVAIGEALLAPDGRLYEITNVASNTSLTVYPAYLGTTQTAQAYTIAPTQGFIRDLASEVAALINGYSTVYNTVGAGKFPDGTVGAPGIRFAADEDVGIRRISANTMALVVNGTDIAVISTTGLAATLDGSTGLPIATGVSGLGANVAAWLADPTSAKLRALLTDKTGTGVAVFADSPALTGTPTAPTAAAGTNTTQLATTAHVVAERSASRALTNLTGITVVSGGASITGNSSVTGQFAVGKTSFDANAFAFQGYGNSYANGVQMTYDGVGSAGVWVDSAGKLNFGVDGASGTTSRMALDASGNLLVGTANGANHCLWKNVSDGTLMLDIAKTAGVPTARFYTCSAAVDPSAAGANLLIWRDATTSRSINAAGTINQSGADYAEYEHNNGTKFAKGQIVGFKEDGTLTDVYADAIRFGVKSTNPGLVGGDAWGTDKQVGKRPEEPQFAAPEYQGPQDPGTAPIEPVQQSLPEDASNEDKAQASDDFAAAHAAWVTASAAYEKLAYEYRAAQQDHEARVEIAKNLFDTATYPEYQRALTAFEARLEAERQTVDRIAYCGKVPVAVYGASPGGYIIADKDHDGKIIGKFVADPDFAQYKKAMGRVNRIMDAEASAHLVEAINSTDPAQFVGMAEIAVITH